MGLDMYLNKYKKSENIADITQRLNDVFETKGDDVWERYRKLANEIFPEIGYWRKSNQIHQWFVDNVQGGEDECERFEVSKEQLETLLSLVNQVLENHTLASELLPTQEGFFFGGTDYDEGYFEDLEDTKTILEKVLAETDFEKETVTYRSSW